jgi:hypothetical protein
LKRTATLCILRHQEKFLLLKQLKAPNKGTLKWIAFDNMLSVPAAKTDWDIYKYILDKKPFAFGAGYDEQLNLLSLTEEIENIHVL